MKKQAVKNNHKRRTPSTKGKEGDDRRFTSYDTSKGETSTPQKARESRESTAEQSRFQNGKKK
jgi:hypothetical protein